MRTTEKLNFSHEWQILKLKKGNLVMYLEFDFKFYTQ